MIAIETADVIQLMVALRERRAAECEKERAALALAAGQARTVAAELRRVLPTHRPPRG